MGDYQEVTRDSKGFYRYNGQKLLSVTNVIRRGHAEPDRLRDARLKHSIQSAIAEPGKSVEYHLEAADRAWNPLSAKGTRVHTWAEQFIAGNREPEDCEDCGPYVEGFLRFVDRYRPKWLMSERVAIDTRVGFAGRFDFIADIDYENLGTIIGDFKTTRWASYNKPEWPLQMSAYANAEGVVNETDSSKLDPLPVITKGLVVVLPGDGSYRAVKVDVGKEVFSVFKAMAKVSKFQDISELAFLGDLP